MFEAQHCWNFPWNTTQKPVAGAALLSSAEHGSEAPQTGCPEQLTDPAEQRIIMQAEVTLGDETVYAFLS